MRKPTFWICSLADSSEINLSAGRHHANAWVVIAFPATLKVTMQPPPDVHSNHDMLTPTTWSVKSGYGVRLNAKGHAKLLVGLDTAKDVSLTLRLPIEGREVVRATIKGRDQIVLALASCADGSAPFVPRTGKSERIGIRITDENGEAMQGFPVRLSAIAGAVELFLNDKLPHGHMAFLCRTDTHGELPPLRTVLLKDTQAKHAHIMVRPESGNFGALSINVSIAAADEPGLLELDDDHVQAIPPMLRELHISLATSQDQPEVPTDEWEETPTPPPRYESIGVPPILLHPTGVDFGNVPRPFDISPIAGRSWPLGWKVAALILLLTAVVVSFSEIVAEKNGTHVVEGARAAFISSRTQNPIQRHGPIEPQFDQGTMSHDPCSRIDPLMVCDSYKVIKRDRLYALRFDDCRNLGGVNACECDFQRKASGVQYQVFTCRSH